MTEHPIDAVYTWIDGGHPQFRSELQQVIEAQQADPELRSRFTGTSTATNRFRNRDELRYSLRSLARYAPWLRRIYLVTKRGHAPDWIDQAHPGLRVVYEDEIFANPGYLPTFSSQAVELQFLNIPGLADRFINMNDDFMLCQPVTPEMLFGARGEPVPIYIDYTVAATPGMVENHPGFLWGYTLRNTHELLNDDPELIPASERCPPAHLPYAYYRPHLEDVLQRYADAVDHTSGLRLRHERSITLTFLYQHFLLSNPNIATQTIDASTASYRMVSLRDDLGAARAALDEAAEQRFVCVQDDLSDLYPNPVAGALFDWFEANFPEPAPFEVATNTAPLAYEANLLTQDRPGRPAATYRRSAAELQSDAQHASDQIFIQIAAYRDPQLGPTIEDCLARAAHPERLRFGICWQRDSADDQLQKFREDPRFRIIDLPWQESRGACWARSKLAGLYRGEAYCLQLDSHHRFVQDWDLLCIEMLEALPSERPVLTAYLPPYEPREPDAFGDKPGKLVFHEFNRVGLLSWRMWNLDHQDDASKPIPARFYSAHFCFAHGHFCQNVAHDPDLYFHGEELSIALRAWTSGYDLFHPNRVLAWHQYTREDRPKHWTDHIDGATATDWEQLDQSALARVRRLVGADEPDGPLVDPENFGLGRERSLADYQRFAGIHFGLRIVQQSARLGAPPPGPTAVQSEADWLAAAGQHWLIHARWTADQFPELDDYDWCDFWVEDEAGNRVFRRFLEGARFAAPRTDDDLYLDVVVQSVEPPARWCLHLRSASRGWLPRLVESIQA